MFEKALPQQEEMSSIVVAHRDAQALQEIALGFLEELRFSEFAGASYDDWDDVSNEQLRQGLEEKGLWILKLGGESYEPLRRWREAEDGTLYWPVRCEQCGDLLMLDEVYQPEKVDQWGKIHSSLRTRVLVCNQCYENSKKHECPCCGAQLMEWKMNQGDQPHCPVCLTDMLTDTADG